MESRSRLFREAFDLLCNVDAQNVIEPRAMYAITYIPRMKTLSSTELLANLSAVMDRVNDDHESVIAHRAKGKPVVMVSLEDWASLGETTYLTSSPANKAALDEAIRSLNEGEGIVKTMEELEAMARD